MLLSYQEKIKQLMIDDLYSYMHSYSRISSKQITKDNILKVLDKLKIKSPWEFVKHYNFKDAYNQFISDYVDYFGIVKS